MICAKSAIGRRETAMPCPAKGDRENPGFWPPTRASRAIRFVKQRRDDYFGGK
ncbi:MAG: hypothetical protein JGK32_31820 [Microcoleus sp. PH2017_31_RDM_U_A]|uniref:hypothetical protein n=1 Tax=unclassified Microcoleus TaxID=2642155 RepID=UPI001DF69BA0|nr:MULTISPECIES: hypothetical protein [unclassified Microcoleus]MCC3569805.1 hypothetical protein [Microcoleus sp. PH2017_31_RDM_U_A]MCC3620000.1 hypothetical protein [Microcoleus sp. PH2017_38_RDM_U_B]